MRLNRRSCCVIAGVAWFATVLLGCSTDSSRSVPPLLVTPSTLVVSSVGVPADSAAEEHLIELNSGKTTKVNSEEEFAALRSQLGVPDDLVLDHFIQDPIVSKTATPTSTNGAGVASGRS